MHPKVQVSAELSDQWRWGCQSGSGLASNFFGTAYQHIGSISLPVPKRGWALKVQFGSQSIKQRSQTHAAQSDYLLSSFGR